MTVEARRSCAILYNRVTTLQTEKNHDFSRRNCRQINILNKCTFLNTKCACYEVLVAFQKLTEVNSKRWTSDMQTELKYEQSAGKLCDVWARVLAHHRHCQLSVSKYCHFAYFPDYTNSLTFPWLCAFSMTFYWTLQNSLIFPGFQKFYKSGNPDIKAVSWKTRLGITLSPDHIQLPSTWNRTEDKPVYEVIDCIVLDIVVWLTTTFSVDWLNSHVTFTVIE